MPQDEATQAFDDIGPLGEGLPSKVLNTPAMRQFLEIKKKYKEAFLFYRMGDFYELFFKDAVRGAKFLDVALTSRSSKNSEARIPMAGVPAHSVGQYVEKLTDLGHTVVICDQIQDPSEAKGIVERKVTRVVSPGLSYDSDRISAFENIYLASLAYSKSQSAFALSYVDLSTGECAVGEVTSLSHLEDELVRIQPKEILYSKDQNLKDVDQEFFKSLVEKDRWYFRALEKHYFKPKAAETILCDHFKVQKSKSLGVADKESFLSSLGALFRYLYDTQIDHGLSHIDRIQKIDFQNRMLLDQSTIHSLELFPKESGQGVSHANSGHTHSLFELLDQTKTPMGKRKLRSWLSYPLVDQSEIEQRLEALSFFSDHPAQLQKARKYLEPIYDLERILGKLSLGSAKPQDLIRLKVSLEHLPSIREILNEAESERLNFLADQIQDHRSVFKSIDERIADPAPAGIHEGKLIKKGFHGKRDECSELSHHVKEKLAELETKEKEKTGIPNLKIKYNKVFGYFIEVTRSHLEKVPESFQRRQTTVNSERFITPELKEFESKAQRAQDELIQIEQSLWKDLLNEIQKELSALLKTARFLAEIDVICSFSKTAMDNEWTRPLFAKDDALRIEGGRHPVVEKNLPFGSFVPNDTFMDASGEIGEFGRLHLVTGPNMAGKSTVMRQIALMVILAQVGSFVPAQKLEMGIVDRVFTRIGASDNISEGESTFMVEMSETAQILSQAGPRSLILLDEVGRGTSTYDGLAIAWGLVEYIHEKISARTFFATHYHELTELEDKLVQLKNFNMLVEEDGDQVTFLHRIEKGAAPGSYGIHVARLAGIPKELLDRSEELLKELEKNQGFKPQKRGHVERPPEKSTSAMNDEGKFKASNEAKPGNEAFKETGLKKLGREQIHSVLKDLDQNRADQLDLFAGRTPPEEISQSEIEAVRGLRDLTQELLSLDLMDQKPFDSLKKVHQIQKKLLRRLQDNHPPV
jgi:DNA mismatch repair protein MutS